MNKYLLNPEERSQVIQCSVAKWAICEPQFIEDIADVISKAQHKKSIGEFIKRIDDIILCWYDCGNNNTFEPRVEYCGVCDATRACQWYSWQQLKKEVLE